MHLIIWGMGGHHIFVYNVNIDIHCFSLKLLSDIPSVYLKNVYLECLIDIQILYFEVMFS